MKRLVYCRYGSFVFSDKGPTLETLSTSDYIRIGSTPTFSYFDLLESISACSQTSELWSCPQNYNYNFQNYTYNFKTYVFYIEV